MPAERRPTGPALAVVFAVLLAALPGCFPYVLPPGQLEVGLARDGKWGQGTIAHATAGIHTASIPTLVDKPMDFGVGYGADFFGARHGRNSEVRVHGPYAEASRFVFRRPNVRVSVGLRGEMLIKDGELGWGALARSGAELFHEHSVPAGPWPCEVHGGSGALGFGVYVESGYQQLPWAGHAFIATAGFTFRWPFAYGVIVYGCE